MPRLRRPALLLMGSAVIGASAIGASALAAGTHAAAGTRAAPIRAQASFSGGFLPARLVVRPGTVVYLRSTDHLKHNAVAEKLVNGKPAFTSGAPTSGAFHFRAPSVKGTYTYACQVHGFMQGTLVVR